MNSNEQLKLAYTEAIAQLRLHPALIWTRNNFFLLINSGLLAFATSGSSSDWKGPPFLIPLSGMFLSLIWVWTNWAGQQIQRHWRQVVLGIETDLFQPEHGETSVEGPFSRASKTAKEGTSWLMSITSALITLSVGFCVCWGYLLTKVFQTVAYAS